MTIPLIGHDNPRLATSKAYIFCALSCIIGLSGCASAPNQDLSCGTVSAYLQPPVTQHWYRAVVTHLNGSAVISQPNYLLPPGQYQFTLVELIDDPNLSVALAARTPKTLTLTVAANERYHLGALFHTDKIYRGKDTSYWEPGIWQRESHDCKRPTP